MQRKWFVGAVGACLSLLALALLVPVPPHEVAPMACTIVDESSCAGRIRDDFGAETAFVVTQPGSFVITSGSPRAWISIADAMARPLAHNAPGGVLLDLAPGTYTIRVDDSTPGHARMVPGGFAYQLVVARSGWRPADSAIAMR